MARTGEDRRGHEIAFMQAQFHEPLCAVLRGSDWTTMKFCFVGSTVESGV